MSKNCNPPGSSGLILGWLFFHIPQASDHSYCLESSFLTALNPLYLLQLLHVLIQLLGDSTDSHCQFVMLGNEPRGCSGSSRMGD